MKKFLSTFIIALAAGAAFPQSSLYQTSVMRVCQFDESREVKNCIDRVDDTVFHVAEELQWIRIYTSDSDRAGYEHHSVISVENPEEGVFVFTTMESTTNAVFWFSINFNSKSIYLSDSRDKDYGFMYFYTHTWRE